MIPSAMTPGNGNLYTTRTLLSAIIQNCMKWGKGKVILLHARSGYRNSYCSMTAALEGVSGQQHAPAALYHRYRRLGRPGWTENFGIRSRPTKWGTWSHKICRAMPIPEVQKHFTWNQLPRLTRQSQCTSKGAYRISREYLANNQTTPQLFGALKRTVFILRKSVYLVLVYLVTAFVPSLTACLASSPGNNSRTAVCISRLVIVDRLL